VRAGGVDAAPRDECEAWRVRLGIDETPSSFRRVRDPRAVTMASRRDLLEEVSGASAGADIASDAPGLELVALVVMCGVCVVLQAFMARRGAVKHGAGDHVAFQRLRRRYNAVYALGTFGDWIQGAYLYALYREHGFEMANIGYIFVLGYFASATLGTYVAALGDQHGHRKLVMLYGVSYGIACVAMRWSSLAVLLVSRVLSGVAYSLLFSSFESWAITEVDRMRIDRRYLVQLFSAATFFNAASAVAAGIAGKRRRGESGRTDGVRDGGEQVRARVRRRRGLVVHVRAGREDVVGGGGSRSGAGGGGGGKVGKLAAAGTKRRGRASRGADGPGGTRVALAGIDELAVRSRASRVRVRVDARA
jgi:hypothetical protein